MRGLKLSERTKERLAGLVTVVVCAGTAVVLGQLSWKFLHAVWGDYWIRKDANPVRAIVTQVGPKHMLDYRYTVNGRNYAGRDSRDWEEEKDHPANLGDQVTARVSASHPWLSALGDTGRAWMGLPIFLALSVFELMVLGLFCSGILKLVFGFSLVNEQDSPVAGLMVGAFLLVFLVLALLGRRRNRAWRFRIYRR